MLTAPKMADVSWRTHQCADRVKLTGQCGDCALSRCFLIAVQKCVFVRRLSRAAHRNPFGDLVRRDVPAAAERISLDDADDVLPVRGVVDHRGAGVFSGGERVGTEDQTAVRGRGEVVLMLGPVLVPAAVSPV
jgi:hypothetical protein